MYRRRITFALILITASSATIGCRSGKSEDMEEPVAVTISKPPEVSFIPKTIEIDGKEYRYAVYVPSTYTSRRSWPAIVFLNGSGERGDDGVKQTKVGIGPQIQQYPERFNCIVIMPQCQAMHVWTDDDMMALVMGCIAKTEQEYKIDENRIALTGLSLGGFGTWKLGAVHGERFCALGPICGGGETEWARELAKTPIWCFHGDADPVVPVDKTREMAAVVLAAGGDIRYTEFPEVSHNSWDPAYKNAEFIAWLLRKR